MTITFSDLMEAAGVLNRAARYLLNEYGTNNIHSVEPMGILLGLAFRVRPADGEIMKHDCPRCGQPCYCGFLDPDFQDEDECTHVCQNIEDPCNFSGCIFHDPTGNNRTRAFGVNRQSKAKRESKKY